MRSALHLSRLAAAAAARAADYLRRVDRPRDPAAWAAKGHNDFVTECDTAAERLIADSLRAAEPDSTIVGEELSPGARREGLCWIVDPIDGTTNFAHGFPVYAVSIAAEVDGELLAGVVLEVEANRIYHGWRGGGAWLDEARIRVSTITEPSHALIGTGFPFKHPDHLARYQRQFARIAPATAGIRRAGSAALDLAWVASGAFDAFWELRLAPWDMAAGALLVREAGGVVTDLEGNPVGAADGPVLAGSPAMHAWLLTQMVD
ncbi:MAG: inositol monophosphatase family protein [Gemmatimonadales bacterium]